MADTAADFFSSAGGLDALAFAVAQQQASSTSAGTPAPNGTASSSTTGILAPLEQQRQEQNGQGAGPGASGTSYSGPMDGLEAASLLGALSGHQAHSPGAPLQHQHAHPFASSSTHGSSAYAGDPGGGSSIDSPDGSSSLPTEDAPIPHELLEWDDTLTTAERVKLGKRALSGPLSSPLQVKKEPGLAKPAKKKKPKTTVGAVAAAAAAAGSPKSKPAAKGKAKPKAKSAAAAAAAPPAGAAPSAPAVAPASSSTSTATAAPVKKDKGKFRGLGRAWRKGLNISGDRLKEMTREEIELEIANKGGWTPGAGGNAAASGSGTGASAAAAKKPASVKPSTPNPPPSNGASAGKKKATSKSATPSVTAAGSSSAVPAKRKATGAADGKTKKSSKSTAKKTVLSATASLSRGRNSPSPGAGNNRSRSATADRHGSFSVEPSGPPLESKHDEEEEKDDSLYCLCQELYDEDRVMLACDICEQWYHPTCVGLPEDRIDLVGQFICPRCVDQTDERTTWKTKCQTEGCFKSAVPGLTKYCSTTCGETHLVRLLENAGLPRRHFEAFTADAQPPSGACIANSDFPGGPPFPMPAIDEPQRQLLERAADLRRSIETVEDHLGLLGKRLTLLSLATRRADLVQLDNNGALLINGAPGQEQHPPPPQQQPVPEEPYNPKKKKSKFDSGPAANRVCGFDERLVLGEVEWAAWVRSDEGVATVGPLGPAGDEVEPAVGRYMQVEVGACDYWCGKSKKRCDAHSAWHKIRLDDFLLEQSAKRTQLAALRDSLETMQKELGLLDRSAIKKRQLNGEVVDEEDAEMAIDAAADAVGPAPVAPDPLVPEPSTNGDIKDGVMLEPEVKAESATAAAETAFDVAPASPRPNGQHEQPTANGSPFRVTDASGAPVTDAKAESEDAPMAEPAVTTDAPVAPVERDGEELAVEPGASVTPDAAPVVDETVEIIQS